MRTVQYKSSSQSNAANTQTGMSPAIWGDLPIEDWAINMAGMLLIDDFENCSKMNAVGAQQVQNYASFTTAATSVIQPSAASQDPNGVVVLKPNTAGNAETYMGACGGVGYLCTMPNSSGVGNQFAFECRLYQSVIAATDIGFAVGLGDPALGITTGSLQNTSTDIISTANFIGFRAKASVGNTVDAIFQAASQTQQTAIAGAATLAANTYIKLGFRYDPRAPATKLLRFFVNGVEQMAASAYITQAMMALATFPSSALLTPMILAKVAAGATGQVGMDWWAFGQVRN